jgi:GT2 family glycosyltransferase
MMTRDRAVSVVVISKDEPELDLTLESLEELTSHGGSAELVVVDASAGRLENVRQRHPAVRWVDFVAPQGAAVSIPHQRNAGVRLATGDVIVFLDAGCLPEPGWLTALTAPLLAGEESVVCGVVGRSETPGLYDSADRAPHRRYVTECPTLNLAFHRKAFVAVGGFDERFRYGSDVDFSWRLLDAGYRILQEPAAVVSHDWGGRRRQVRRAYAYGSARLRLYRKHRHRRREVLRRDPIAVAYPLFLVGLPAAWRFPRYLLLLGIPLWTNRRRAPFRAVANNLAFGAGVLRELMRSSER